jgi:hypothetical protein
MNRRDILKSTVGVAGAALTACAPASDAQRATPSPVSRPRGSYVDTRDGQKREEAESSVERGASIRARHILAVGQDLPWTGSQSGALRSPLSRSAAQVAVQARRAPKPTGTGQ